MKRKSGRPNCQLWGNGSQASRLNGGTADTVGGAELLGSGSIHGVGRFNTLIRRLETLAIF